MTEQSSPAALVEYAVRAEEAGYDLLTSRRPASKIGQLPVSWGRDRAAAKAKAGGQFRWFAGGWKVNSELPGPAGFAALVQVGEERPDEFPKASPDLLAQRRGAPD